VTTIEEPSAIETFIERPILNSPYARPTHHWELDESGQPRQKIVETRRRADFVTPIPKPKKRKRAADQQVLIDPGRRDLHAGAAVRPDVDHQRGSRVGRGLAQPAAQRPSASSSSALARVWGDLRREAW
jgi:hypothetical protein